MDATTRPISGSCEGKTPVATHTPAGTHECGATEGNKTMTTFKIITAAITVATLTFAAAGTSFAGQGCGRAQGAHGNGGAVNSGYSRSQNGYGHASGFQSISSPAVADQGPGIPAYGNEAASAGDAGVDDEDIEDDGDEEDESGDDVADGNDADDDDDDDEVNEVDEDDEDDEDDA